MSFLDDLSFGFSKTLPVIVQTEVTECGLACLAMISTYYDNRIDLAELRRRNSISLRGSSLDDIVKIADQLQLATRSLKLQLEDIHLLRCPCVLHWNFNHFVVLKGVKGTLATIHDPAYGVRKVEISELSNSFTGVALELWPSSGFKKQNLERKFSIGELLGRVSGLFQSFVQVLLLAVALEVFTLVSPLFLQWVVDQAIVSADRDLLATLAIGFGLLAVMRVAIGAVRSWILMHMGTTLNIQWRANVFAHLMRLPTQYFFKRHVGDIQSRFGGIDKIQTTLTTSFVEAVLDGMMSIATLIIMFLFSPVLASIALGAMVLYGLTRLALYGTLHLAQRSQIIFAAKQESHFLESVRGARAIKLFRREDQRRASWLSILVDQINAGLHLQKLQIGFGAFNSLITSIEAILVIWLGALMVLDGSFSVGVLMAFKAYNDQFNSRLSMFIDKLMQFQLLKVHGIRLADIVLSPPERSYGEPTLPDITSRTTSINVSNLYFKFSDHEPTILKGISFSVKQGESVAIIGPSGCGKTTLINVMLGILQPTAGDVVIGGVSLRIIGTDSIRQMIGTVMQDDTLFAGSIAENICFFDSTSDHNWIEECAKMAGVHESIVAMPMGYNSLVGDMGTVLSGGQKQLVLLARALYKRPSILFLDEATSHLDVEKERQVNAAIRALNMTRIVVAHRQETIASADRVISIYEGRIASDVARTGVVSGPTGNASASQASTVRSADPVLPLAPAYLRIS